MATITAKRLNDGTVPSSETAIYTAGGSVVSATIASLLLFSTNAAAQTIIVKAFHGATGRIIDRVVLSQNQRQERSYSLVLGAGDSIKISTTTNNGVDYWLSGVEVT